LRGGACLLPWEKERSEKVVYRIECTKESGVILWLEAPCGFKQPLIRWASLDGVKRLADILSNFYSHKMEENRTKDNEMKAIADKLLEQALGGNGDA
jgi:hypothetical protein